MQVAWTGARWGGKGTVTGRGPCPGVPPEGGDVGAGQGVGWEADAGARLGELIDALVGLLVFGRAATGGGGLGGGILAVFMLSVDDGVEFNFFFYTFLSKA
jgi:hypothetical protein